MKKSEFVAYVIIKQLKTLWGSYYHFGHFLFHLFLAIILSLFTVIFEVSFISLWLILVAIILADTINIRKNTSIDASGFLIFPVSTFNKFLGLWLQEILSIKIIYLILLTLSCIYLFPAAVFVPAIINIILLYLSYNCLSLNIIMMARRSKAYSIIFKTALIIIISLAFSPGQFFTADEVSKPLQLIENYYRSGIFFILFFLSVFLAIIFLFSYRWYKNNSLKYPFPDQQVMDAYNKNYWY